MSLRSTLSITTAAAALLAGLPLLADDGTPDAQGVFGEVIDVRVINLEVVVTDKQGERVRRLRPEDFAVTVDGNEVPIEYFTEVDSGIAVAADDAGVLAVPSLEPGGEAGTSFLVFIDDYFSRYLDRNRVIDEMLTQLPLLGPADRMAIVAFDGRKLAMLANWSQSVHELERALRTAKERPAYGLHQEVRERAFSTTTGFDDRIDTRLVGNFDGRFVTDFEDIQTRAQLGDLVERLRRATLAATTALRSFASPPGRKAMLLLAGGWPDNPIDALAVAPAITLYNDGLGYGRSLYGPLFDTANRLSFTVYPVDVRGLRSESGAGAEHATLGEAQLARNLSSNRDWAENGTLVRLARETGGEAFLNGRNRQAFEGAWRDTRSYYWLGFTPTWRGEDRRHDVRVTLRDPKLEVRTRRGYTDLSRQTEVTMMVESALLFGDPPGASTLQAEVGEGASSGFRKKTLPLKVAIPLDELTFLPGAEGVVSEAELRVAVEDKNGDRSEIPVIPLHFAFAEAPPPGKVLTYETGLRMRNMKHDVVVSLYDRASGRMLWTRMAVEP